MAKSKAGGGFNWLGTLANEEWIGSDGSDIIRGSGGNDTLSGGKSSDRFVFESTLEANGVDVIKDFAVKSSTSPNNPDVLDLSLVLGKSRKITSSNINDYVQVKGDELFIDLDGTGSGSAQKWATLEGVKEGDQLNIRTSSFDGWITAVESLGIDIGGNPNTSNLTVDFGSQKAWWDEDEGRYYTDNDEFFTYDFGIVDGSQYRNYDLGRGDAVKGAFYYETFVPGEGIPVPDTFFSTGDDKVNESQFEVYYGYYDSESGIFTIDYTREMFKEFRVTAPANTPTHTLILYDNDARAYRDANFNLFGVWGLPNGPALTGADPYWLEGFIVDGWRYERSWQVVGDLGSRELVYTEPVSNPYKSSFVTDANGFKTYDYNLSGYSNANPAFDTITGFRFDGASGDRIDLDDFFLSNFNLTVAESVSGAANIAAADTIDELNALFNSTNGTAATDFTGGGDASALLTTNNDGSRQLVIDLNGSGTFTERDIMIAFVNPTVSNFDVNIFV